MKLTVSVEINDHYENIGILQTKPGIGPTFRYTETWLTNHTGLPLSLSLPANETEYPEKSIKPYFEGLLPEEYARTAIARKLGVSQHSYIKLLAALNDECIGAVMFTNEDNESAPPEPSYEQLSAKGLESLAAREYAIASGISAESRLSLAGAQSKVGLYRDPESGSWFIPHATAPSNCILKPNSSNFPELIDNELFCLQLASACGLPAANAQHASTASPMLIIERYDRGPSAKDASIDGHVRYSRLHQEDFCQALGIPSTLKYEDNASHYASKMAELLRRYSASPVKDISCLFDIFVFNYLIGNCDAHLKNHSIIRNRDWRELRLAPAYDLVSTTAYPELTTSMGIYIGTEKKLERITPECFYELAKEMHVSPRVAKQQISELREKLSCALNSSDVCCHITQTIAEQTSKRITKLRD